MLVVVHVSRLREVQNPDLLKTTMYNIDQLNEMSENQLRDLAKSMGLKKVDSVSRDDLVYEVLDHQAESDAANTPEPTKRRRERIRKPAAQANGSEVTKDDAVPTKNKKGNKDKQADLMQQTDKNAVEAENLPEPSDLAALAKTELETALAELDELLKALEK